MTALIPVELRCDEYDSKHVKWSITKLAFYLLASEISEPKYENSLGVEWIATYPMEARWDKSLLSKQQFDDAAAPWRRTEPAAFSPRMIQRIQVIARFKPRESVSCGVDRDDPQVFDHVMTACLSSVRYDRFEYRKGRPEFIAEAPATVINEIVRARGMEPIECVRALGETPVKALLYGFSEPGWKAPFMFTDE